MRRPDRPTPPPGRSGDDASLRPGERDRARGCEPRWDVRGRCAGVCVRSAGGCDARWTRCRGAAAAAAAPEAAGWSEIFGTRRCGTSHVGARPSPPPLRAAPVASDGTVALALARSSREEQVALALARSRSRAPARKEPLARPTASRQSSSRISRRPTRREGRFPRARRPKARQGRRSRGVSRRRRARGPHRRPGRRRRRRPPRGILRQERRGRRG